jgi:hypothetical protein
MKINRETKSLAGKKNEHKNKMKGITVFTKSGDRKLFLIIKTPGLLIKPDFLLHYQHQLAKKEISINKINLNLNLLENQYYYYSN